METTHKHHHQAMHANHYLKLGIMALLSYITMYFLMYAMVDSFANVISNINQFYMAGLMTAPMVILEILLMGGMYQNKKLHLFIIVTSSVLLVSFFLFIRKQTAVSDLQFLKSMIPHHAAAILMVKETELEDPEIRKLAEDIISAQQAEIEFMKARLKQLEKK